MSEALSEPRHHSDCCLSISDHLFASLAGVIGHIAEEAAKQLLVLSVGCGTGFFEAQFAAWLQRQGLSHVTIEGVEVASANVKHLTDELVHRVSSTQSICRRAEAADILLFVYPREGSLVKHYVTTHTRSIRLVLWLGPRADWVTQMPYLQNLPPFEGPFTLSGAGLAPYEIAIIYRNCMDVSKQDNLSIAGKELPGLDIDSI